MRLSVLIPSIESRKQSLDLLIANLEKQKTECFERHPMLGAVNIIAFSTKSFLDGGPSIGEKRNELVTLSGDDYLCFLDDDDTVPPNYIESLLRLCYQGLDICTFRALMKLRDFWGILDMRLAYSVNDQATPEYTMRRRPWHICPVRSEFAKLYEFEDKNNAEDFAWMEKVLGHCSTEAHTEKILFQYNHGPHSEADRIEFLSGGIEARNKPIISDFK